MEHHEGDGTHPRAMLPVRDVPVRADESGACRKIDQSLNESSGQQTLLRQKEASRGFLDECICGKLPRKTACLFAPPPHGTP
jgi:hypothetical protein